MKSERSVIWASAFLGGIIGMHLSTFLPFGHATSATIASNLYFGPQGSYPNVSIVTLGTTGGAAFFCNPDQKCPLSGGVYEDTPQAFLVMANRFSSGAAVNGLFRIAGGNDSPVLVFKDRGHGDRMILGLAMNGPDERPFLSINASTGQSEIFGEKQDTTH